MKITSDLLQNMGCKQALADKFADSIDAACERFEINTPRRISYFLAQICHESGLLKYTREIWNPEQCPWQARYEGRADLGNNRPGDGERFKGRGLIQITGRANYKGCGDALGVDLVGSAYEQLELPELAALSAAWFWDSRGCNELADKGDFEKITRRINGGLNGIDDRKRLLTLAEKAVEEG